MKIILCHLGAGFQKEDKKYKVLIKNALQFESNALSSVVNCVTILENSGIVNCGSGSVNRECDALIVMDNRFGSVTNITVLNPIKAAKYLIELPSIVQNKISPLMVCGDTYWKKRGLYIPRNFKLRNPNGDMNDTVGCIAFIEGKMCIGTSSGGIQLKDFGRVGSSALYGVGAYYEANESKSIGITSTGSGEQIILSDFCRKAIALLMSSENHVEILDTLIKEFLTSPSLDSYLNKFIGVIILIKDNLSDSHEFLYAHTTPTLFFGYNVNGKIKVHFSKLLRQKNYVIGNLPLQN
eukprot:NODE_333_length_9325_cov_0.557230.p6 type:complete len:295 gc:universal NODE_333_length_9325_cov_0.557230:4225-3341(-)